MAETPFTLSHPERPDQRGLSAQDIEGLYVEARDARHIPSSKANYWDVDERVISNMQWVVTPLDPTVPILKMPHACVSGSVDQVLKEDDGDTHVWLTLDGGKFRIACEWTPQTNVLPPPKVGEKIRVYGIIRYDLQHGWPELHPVDFWEYVDGRPAGGA